jgi:hypothetical protein
MRHGPRYKVWTVWRNERSNPWFPEASFRWALSNLGIGGTNIEAVSECPAVWKFDWRKITGF